MTTRSATVLLWLLGGMHCMLQPSPAEASCNAIPAGSVRFRGWRGTVDRPFLRERDDLTLRPACGSIPLPDAGNARVTIIAKSPVNGVLQIRPKDAPEGLRFQVPAMTFAGPVAIAVTSAAESSDQPPLSDLAKKSCKEFTRSDLFVCIDELFTSDGGSCGNEIHPMFAAVTALPTENDFRKLCTKDNGEDPRCSGAAEPSYAVTYTLDTSGNVLLNMSWDSILRPKTHGSQQKERRYVQGGVIAAFLNSGNPIDVPSAAFLDSFNPEGVSFDPKPLFLPGVLPEPTVTPGQGVTAGQTVTPTPKPVAFYGTADQKESVLRIARRKLWKYACEGGDNNGQACEPQPLEQTDKQDCPARTPTTGPEPTCKEQLSASYFACLNGERDKRPCTRPHHCPGGECRKLSQLHCVSSSGGHTAKPCTTDSDCDLGQECGLWLFRLSGTLKDGIGVFPRGKYHAEARHYQPH